MANGLFGMMGRPLPGAPARAPAPARGAPPARFPAPQRGTPPRFGGHAGFPGRPPGFAEGGEVDEGGAPDVSPDLKLAAYELLECLDSSRYGNEKGGRAEAFAKALLAFVRLADEQPHAEGEHAPDEPDSAGDEDYEE